MTQEPNDSLCALLFPGQGAHTAQMLNGYREMADFSTYYDVLSDVLGYSPLCEVENDATKINTNTLSSMFTLLASKLAHNRYIESGMPKPAFFAGYSVGQYYALHAAGCFDFAELIRVIDKRTQLMDSCFREVRGSMLGIAGVPQNKVEELVSGLNADGHKIWISNFNCIGQFSLAGEKTAIEEALSRAAALEPKKLIELPVGGAWHCPLLKNSLDSFAAFLVERSWKLPSQPVINNVDGELLPDSIGAIKEELVKHLSSPVRWESGIRTLIAKGCKSFAEVGYGNVLTKFGFFLDRNLEFRTYSGELKN